MDAVSQPVAGETPFVVVQPDAPGPALVLCDHATNHIPDWASGGDLGLSEADMNRHIAFDPGAEAVSRHLAQAMNAPAILSRFSRLVIDPNRGPDDPTLVMQLYDGSIIPGNRRVDAAEVARRKALAYDPYHDAITTQIDTMLERGVQPNLIAIHSFTQQLRGKDPRPWHIGVLWDRDDRLARPLIEALAGDPEITVGDNEPYSGQLRGDCMYRHGTERGLPHVLIELRNDLIVQPAEQMAWAARLAPLLQGLLV